MRFEGLSMPLQVRVPDRAATEKQEDNGSTNCEVLHQQTKKKANKKAQESGERDSENRGNKRKKCF